MMRAVVRPKNKRRATTASPGVDGEGSKESLRGKSPLLRSLARAALLTCPLGLSSRIISRSLQRETSFLEPVILPEGQDLESKSRSDRSGVVHWDYTLTESGAATEGVDFGCNRALWDQLRGWGIASECEGIPSVRIAKWTNPTSRPFLIPH